MYKTWLPTWALKQHKLRQRITPLMQSAYAGDAMGMRGQLVSRAGLLGGGANPGALLMGGLLSTVPGASEALGEGRQLDAAAQVATGLGTGMVTDRIARSVGKKNPLAGAAVQLGRYFDCWSFRTRSR